MRLTDTGLAFSASDLARHLGCRHLTTLDRSAAEGRAQKPRWDNPILEVLWCAKLIGTTVYGDRSFSVRTQSKTGDAEISSLFLYTSGVGDGKATMEY